MFSMYVYHGSEDLWGQSYVDMPSMWIFRDKERIVCFSIEQMKSAKSKKKPDIA